MKSFLLVLITLLLVFFVQSSQAQIAEGKCKFLGNITGASTPSDFLDYWNQITPENAGKWESVEATQNTMNWTALDNAYKTAKDNNLLFKQHTFIWGNQQPAWIEALPADQQLAEIEEWIKSYCDRYPDTDFIDVVNEALHDPPTGAGNGNYLAALGGAGTTGWDWVIKSFEITRNHCPDAKLLINDYNIINDVNATSKYKTIISLLKDRGLIDGIGVQGHRFEIENVSTTTLTNNLTTLGNTGLPVYITEFDLGNIGDTGTPDDAKQLELYKNYFPVLWNHPAVHGITLWGYRENEIWVKTAHLKKSTGTERPAFTWLKDYVANNPGGTFCYTGAEAEQNGFSVFPNPVINNKLSVSSAQPLKRLTVFDAKGRRIGEYVCNGVATYDLELNENPGLYLLRIETSDKMFTRKLILQE